MILNVIFKYELTGRRIVVVSCPKWKANTPR